MKKLLSLLLVFIIAFSVVSPAFAEEGDPGDTGDTGTGEATTEDAEYTHPLVALFQAYWDLVNPEVTCDPTTDPTCEVPPACDPTTDPTCEPACDPTTDPTCEPPPEECVPYGEEPTAEQEGLAECPPEFGQLIETLHEEGMGFGVMANLLLIATSCEPAEGGAPCPTFEELVTAFKGGQGVGQLYHQYGNPGKHGVGYLKHAVKCAEADPSGKVPGYCKNADKHNDKGGGPPDGKGGGNPHDD